MSSSRARKECFRRDPRLTDDDAAGFCEDYDEPTFDQGHLVPNADMERSEAAMINTYIFTNMTPQYPRFNRYLWAWLEEFVRTWAKSRGVIYVMSGSIFDKDGDEHRDADSDAARVQPRGRVAIPTHFYRIILFQRPDGSIDSMTILLPHNDDSHKKKDMKSFLQDHLTTIDQIEKLTGMDFFPNLAQPGQDALESFQAQEIWPLESN